MPNLNPTTLQPMSLGLFIELLTALQDDLGANTIIRFADSRDVIQNIIGIESNKDLELIITGQPVVGKK